MLWGGEGQRGLLPLLSRRCQPRACPPRRVVLARSRLPRGAVRADAQDFQHEGPARRAARAVTAGAGMRLRAPFRRTLSKRLFHKRFKARRNTPGISSLVPRSKTGW